MGDQDLARALQELVARHAPPEPGRLAAEIVSRDRRRVGLLAGVTALLWLGGIAVVLYTIVCFNRFVVAYPGADPAEPAEPAGWRAGEAFHAKMELHHGLEACMVAVPALLLAALGTVWLVLSSRRATLTQINISLAEISDQLRRLRPPARPPEGG
jgi:hypothetical protein